ncbi:ROK family protein [Trichomonas vaginalis G3]|uniref:fructokinase n=1 Tax=Trichomonas vaginalis (strain ATCC PRA-98 / G3) TaxID=412133 RepID=A2F1V1_TRIV3|nr:ROK family [Trichomonas vaginalis G3]EAY01096.1 ROK family protein [Trichomonas vaginalis G3]KAI5517413.1 ROK family [Trichomonas vaginalis G3]|eukprot:XP_001313948.1 ROK family protein [Trichomonas vaginalis G3]
MSANDGKKYACGIELGGQTASIAICEKVGEIIYKKKGIKTCEPMTPDEAVANIVAAIKESGYAIDRIGIASFGPLDLYKGSIGNTPKPNWGFYPLVKKIQEAFPDCKVSMETDVNAPAYSEYLHLKEQDKSIRSVGYVTIGTGVGVGVFCDGKPLHGRMHPECGHIMAARVKGDTFEGTCPFHGACFEGLISAQALAKRYGCQQGELQIIPDSDPVWDIYIEYVAQLTVTMSYVYSLDAFIIGGGIITAKGREWIFDKILARSQQLINNYIHTPIISKPFHGADAGLVGACAVAINPDVFAVEE